MHRSGASTVARLLHDGGLDLGAEADLAEGDADHPDGSWENLRFLEVDDAVLEALGGGWDHPPSATGDWTRIPGFSGLRATAEELVSEFTAPCWGWKDPRSSLILPFWRLLVPSLRVLVVVRHPLEVAASLQRRNFFSTAHSLSLWVSHYERILETTRPEERLCAHFESVRDDPVGQLARLSGFVGLPRPADGRAGVAGAVRPELRHGQAAETRDLEVPGRVSTLYARLCEESGYPVRVPVHRRSEPPTGRSYQPRRATLAERLDRVETLVYSVETGRAALEDIRANQQELGHAMLAVQRRSRRVEQAVQQLLRAAPPIADAPADTATPPVDGRAAPEATVENPPDYPDLVRRIRAVVEESLPAGAIVAVTSKGDDALVSFGGRHGWHFPQTTQGVYAGHNPADGLSAVDQLEQLRRRGASHLLLPSTARWWLGHYRELADHLDRSARVVVDDDSCTIFQLAATPRAELAVEPATPVAYQALVGQIRSLVDALLPVGSTALVISRGDPELVRLAGPAAFHFPGDDNGYSGWYPEDSAAAIAHLEDHRRRGAEYLVIPRTARWWLRHYPGLRRHLERKYPRVVDQPRVCMVFDLRDRSAPVQNGA
jgi:hypothetical protein